MLGRKISARIPHPALQATFPPGEGIIAARSTTPQEKALRANVGIGPYGVIMGAEKENPGCKWFAAGVNNAISSARSGCRQY